MHVLNGFIVLNFTFQLVNALRKEDTSCVTDKRMTGSGVIDDVIHEANKYLYMYGYM